MREKFLTPASAQQGPINTCEAKCFNNRWRDWLADCDTPAIALTGHRFRLICSAARAAALYYISMSLRIHFTARCCTVLLSPGEFEMSYRISNRASRTPHLRWQRGLSPISRYMRHSVALCAYVSSRMPYRKCIHIVYSEVVIIADNPPISSSPYQRVTPNPKARPNSVGLARWEKEVADRRTVAARAWREISNSPQS